MAEAVADFFWKRLAEWGVTKIFGYPGDGINGLLGSLQRNDLPFEFIQVRHEEMAAFMASAGNLLMSGKQNCVTDAEKGSCSNREG